MILNSQIWQQTIAAAILAVAGRTDKDAWTRTILAGAKEVERTVGGCSTGKPTR